MRDHAVRPVSAEAGFCFAQKETAIDNELVMELLGDIAKAVQPVAVDYLPMSTVKVMLQTTPPAVVIQIPGATNEPLQAALMDLAKGFKEVFDRGLPSLPLEYRVVGGSEAAGIEIRAKAIPDAEPIYPHIIKAKLAWISFSDAMRRQRPNLPERIYL